MSYTFTDSTYSPVTLSETPMYTKEEIEEEHRKRTMLELEIQSLEDQLKSRKEQIKSARQNSVSPGELSMIKATTRDQISESNSEQLSCLMENFTKTIGDVCHLQVQGQITDQDIKEEEMNRLNITEEFDIIDNAFDFSDLKAKIPKIKTLDTMIPKVDRLDMEGATQALKAAQTELSKIITNKDPSARELQAANAVISQSSSYVQRRLLSTNFQRTEVQRLEMMLSHAEGRTKSLEDETISLRKKLTAIKNDTNNAISSSEAQISANAEIFKEAMSLLDKDANSLAHKIDQSAEWFEKAEAELEAMRTQEVSSFENEEEEEDLFDFDDDKTAEEEMEENLRAQKLKAEEDLKKQKKTLSESRKLALERQKMLQQEVRKCYVRYKEVKAELASARAEAIANPQVSEVPESSSSMFSENLQRVLDQIDNSIIEAQNCLFE